jgi:glycerol kinase
VADFLLAIDQGTTSTRAILFDAALTPIATAAQELRQVYPAPGWVEHDPEEIWSATVATVREALAKAGASAGDVAGIGIANQRETTILWDRATGRPIHNAVVWQDRRTADICAALRQAGHEAEVAARTGLLLDPYFSATKIRWLIEHVEGAGAAAQAGRLAFGTVDSFLLWRLTGGEIHAFANCSACRPRCSRPCTIAPMTSAPRCRPCSAGRSAYWAWPETSRPPRWDKVALSQA